jgi:hypothetical protein
VVKGKNKPQAAAGVAPKWWGWYDVAGEVRHYTLTENWRARAGVILGENFQKKRLSVPKSIA